MRAGKRRNRPANAWAGPISSSSCPQKPPDPRDGSVYFVKDPAALPPAPSLPVPGPHMKLTRLELSGFKSFADTVTLDFGDGVTAIVGPNGCGKSNVSDAVRWVLGEQSARLLRGGKMEDVIFQGSAPRRPVNVTEVSLHLDNVDGTLPIAYQEVV